jgi:hypothetical protein
LSGVPIKGTNSEALIDDLKEYCKEKDYSVDCETFINHYESNGWLVGKNKMKSWQAALGTWNKNSFGVNKEVDYTQQENYESTEDMLARVRREAK